MMKSFTGLSAIIVLGFAIVGYYLVGNSRVAYVQSDAYTITKVYDCNEEVCHANTERGYVIKSPERMYEGLQMRKLCYVHATTKERECFMWTARTDLLNEVEIERSIRWW